VSTSHRIPTSLLIWFGLFAGPAAWTIQHVVGYGLTEASCQEAGQTDWHLSLDLWTIVVTAVALGVGLAGVAAAVLALVRTRDAGTEPPGSRMRFLALVAITVAPLVLFIMVMSGAGVVVISGCRQS
jgi:hypothetical protein